MSFLENLNWRYATKKYNGQEVSQENLDTILEAIRLAPSSSGMQPYHIVVAASAMKDRLIESSGQKDKIGASHLLVFCTRTDYPARGNRQVAIAAELEGKKSEELEGLAKLVRGTTEKNALDLRFWAAKQAYIALGFALAACAELKIDSSPMEGFNSGEFKEILELPEYMDPVVIMALGYRDREDRAQPSIRPKMRFPKDDLFTFRQ